MLLIVRPRLALPMGAADRRSANHQSRPLMLADDVIDEEAAIMTGTTNTVFGDLSLFLSDRNAGSGTLDW